MNERTKIRRLGGCLLVSLIAMAGCGTRNTLGTLSVTGKVTYKGQPVAGAIVSFIPDSDSRPATAVTEANGAYSLMTLDSQGAMPGHYTVLVRKSDAANQSTQPVSMEEALKLNSRPLAVPKELLPAKYADATKSPLKFEVKKGQSNTFDLPLAD